MCGSTTTTRIMTNVKMNKLMIMKAMLMTLKCCRATAGTVYLDSIFGTASTAETETFDDFELSDSDATATLSSDHSDYDSDSDR
jgi:hypothetical protein